MRFDVKAFSFSCSIPRSWFMLYVWLCVAIFLIDFWKLARNESESALSILSAFISPCLLRIGCIQGFLSLAQTRVQARVDMTNILKLLTYSMVKNLTCMKYDTISDILTWNIHYILSYIFCGILSDIVLCKIPNILSGIGPFFWYISIYAYIYIYISLSLSDILSSTYSIF